MVRTIKQSFRLLMNGVTAQSMRDKGVQYKLNWGASLLHLREMAAEYEKDYDLAIALWKEPIRECKILATLLMPTEKLLPEVAEIWMEQTETQEMAELLAPTFLTCRLRAAHGLRVDRQGPAALSDLWLPYSLAPLCLGTDP